MWFWNVRNVGVAQPTAALQQGMGLISTDVSRSSPIDDQRYVFSRLRVEKDRSGVAVVTGKVTSTCSRMVRFGYRDALHQRSLGWFRCSMPALLPRLKLGSELVVTVVDERLIHFHRR